MKFFLVLMSIFLISGVGYAQNQQLCLNKYAIMDARDMMKNLNAANTTKPKPTSVWFNKTVIQNIITLLKSEKPNGYLPDGIRIYLGAIKNGADYKYTVLLASTYKNGRDLTVPSLHYHYDYFDHNPQDQLFLNGQYGDICDDNTCVSGAKLYLDCGPNCPDDQNCSPDDLHSTTRKYGQDLVWNFGSGAIITRCEWFDLDMISEIDNEMTKVAGYDGFRIYFGRHTGNDVLSPNADAFVIEATTAGPNSTHIDYFDCNRAPLYFNKKKSSIKMLLSSYLKDHRHSFVKTQQINILKKLLSQFAGNANGYDNGELCPTHCQGTTPPNP